LSNGKTLASQAKNGGSIPLARSSTARPGERRLSGYQACSVPQCGQPTDVVTLALKTKPHVHE
jgi:hypothetical protein